MIGDIAVQDSAPAQFHEDEYIKDTESRCDHDEEIAGHHHLAPGWSAIPPLTNLMNDRIPIKRRSSFDN
jgi:D-mannonate dehydratase